MIPLFKVFMSKEIDKPLLDVIHSGWIGQCSKVNEFEAALSKRVGNPNCLSLAAGTHGIHLALRLAGVGPGDEVITTPLTCTATNWPILMQGATIVWADIKEEDLNIDPLRVQEAITSHTKAIVVMHWGGYPCDLSELHQIALGHDLVLIEDAAQGIGAEYKGSKIGACEYSDYTMFSFQAIKHLTTVDGGALFLKSSRDCKKGKLLRWYGIDREGPRKDMRCEDPINDWGYKYHMNDVCATVGLVNLRELGWILEKTRSNTNYYKRELVGVPSLSLTQNETNRVSANWLFTLLVEDRDGFARKMTEKGIHVSRVHERNDLHPCTEQFRSSLPVLEDVVETMICIPCGWWVTKENREYIASTIKAGW